MAWPVDPSRTDELRATKAQGRRQGSAHIEDLGEEGVRIAGRVVTGIEAQKVRESFLLGQEDEEAMLTRQRNHQMKVTEFLRYGILPETWMRWTREKSEYVLLSMEERRRSGRENMSAIATKGGAVSYAWNMN